MIRPWSWKRNRSHWLILNPIRLNRCRCRWCLVVPEPVEPPVVPELVEESVPVEPSVDPLVLESVEESGCRLSRTFESVPSLDEPDVESLVLESFEPSVMPGRQSVIPD